MDYKIQDENFYLKYGDIQKIQGSYNSRPFFLKKT